VPTPAVHLYSRLVAEGAKVNDKGLALARLSFLASSCPSNRFRAVVATLALGGALAVGTAVPALAATTAPSSGSVRTGTGSASSGVMASPAHTVEAPQWVTAFQDVQASLAGQQQSDAKAVAAHAAYEHAAQAVAEQKAASGDPRTIAKSMLAQYGWDASQFSYLNQLWFHESNWQVNAANASGAYGIPQALPGSQMASAGADWQTNPATQIKWGLNYIKGRYGSPSGAWTHEQSNNWY
jgi:hypothetical protein